MKSPEYYIGKEQTYIKHFILESYIERVAYNIGSFAPDFVYVDGFSGPWKSQSENYEDTSFVIAINKLRDVRSSLKNRGRDFNIKCLFIEKELSTFKEIKNELEKVDDIKCEVLNGEFENVIPDIVKFIGNSFSFVFIDPTGWTGFALQKIKPILNLRGEVLINFMYDHINRFIEDPRPEIVKSFDEQFGGEGFQEEVTLAISNGKSRENAILEGYVERLRNFGNFSHVTWTRVLKPNQDRSYFHLVYGTRHLKGLLEFRSVEQKSFKLQNSIRDTIRQNRRIEAVGQTELFPADTSGLGSPILEHERIKNLNYSKSQLDNLIIESPRILYDDLLANLLKKPLVWKSDIKGWIGELEKNGKIFIEGLSDREKTPKPNKKHFICKK